MAMKYNLLLTLLLLAVFTTATPTNAENPIPKSKKSSKVSKKNKKNSSKSKGNLCKIGAGSPVFLKEEEVKKYVDEADFFEREYIAKDCETASIPKGTSFKIAENLGSYVSFSLDGKKYYIANEDFLVCKRGSKLQKILQGKKKAPGEFDKGDKVKVKDYIIAFRLSSDAQTYSRILLEKKIEDAEEYALNRMKEDYAIQISPESSLMVEDVSVLSEYVRKKEDLSVFDESDWSEDCTDITINGNTERFIVNTAELYSVKK